MGVSGSGKSTIDKLLAEHFRWEFRDGDRLHSAESISRMAGGHALSDAERLPWLRAVGESLIAFHKDEAGVVIACSALKRSYRDVLREYVDDIFFVFLDGPLDVVEKRIANRNHEFMPPSLLASQYLSLEPLDPDELGIRADIGQTRTQIVDQIEATLRTTVATE